MSQSPPLSILRSLAFTSVLAALSANAFAADTSLALSVPSTDDSRSAPLAGNDGAPAAATASGGNATLGVADDWSLLGNAATNPLRNFIGTTDAQPVVVRSDNKNVLSVRAIQVTQTATGYTANVLAGSPANSIALRVRGATVSGGGVTSGAVDPDFGNEGPNAVFDHYGTVGGGMNNEAGKDDGDPAYDAFATVSGGYRNKAAGEHASVGGGSGNIASQIGSVVGGGTSNVSAAFDTTVGGGSYNEATGHNTTVGGGAVNFASAWMSTIAGGYFNEASGRFGTVGGGEVNTASGDDSTASGGFQNEAFGEHSTVTGGSNNCAGGDKSWAGGHRAKVRLPFGTSSISRTVGCNDVLDVNTLGDVDGDEGTFVWADSKNFDFNSTGPNQFRARATGGFFFYTSINADGTPNVGARLSSGASAWSTLSDRNAKTAIEPVDVQGVLDAVIDLPINTWQYKTEGAAVRHMGPMAQDFSAAFGLGDDDKTISTVDPDGVALAAIQGLNAKLEAELASLRVERTAQVEEMAAMRRDLDALLRAGRR